MKTPKIRLDHLVVRRGLAESGAKAQALLLAGKIRSPGLQRMKPGQLVSEDLPLELVEGLKYVSRGGEKLAGALDTLGLSPVALDAMDVGASTGGFTDCLLQRGAARVFALDVGTGQLHWKLRNDARVISREKTHILKISREDLPFRPSWVVVDVSFIPLGKIMPHLAFLTDPGTLFLTLVKPQFEAGPEEAPKGVVRNPAVRAAVIAGIKAKLPSWGFLLKGECPSPLPGPEGNVEHFLHFVKI